MSDLAPTEHPFLGLMWVENPDGLDRIRWEVFQAPPGSPSDAPITEWLQGQSLREQDPARAGAHYVAALQAARECEPGPRVELLEAWSRLGLASCHQLSRQPERAWPLLLGAFGPAHHPRLGPTAFAADWAERVAELAPLQQEWSILAAAVLLAFQVVFKQGRLQGDRDMTRAWERLHPLREACYQGLMGQERYVEAADFACQVCDHMALTRDPDGLLRWEERAETAERLVDDEDQQEEAGPQAAWEFTVEAEWIPPAELRCNLMPGPQPDPSVLGDLFEDYRQAALLSDQGKVLKGQALYEQTLARLPAGGPEHDLLRHLMLWGKAANLDRMGQTRQAWEALTNVLGPGKQARLPVRFFLSWVQSAVIVAARQSQFQDTGLLLTLLFELGARAEQPALLLELRRRFRELLEGAFEQLAAGGTSSALEWLNALQSRWEPEGELLLPLRQLKFEALTHLLRFEEAEREARQVLDWARERQADEVTEIWEELREHARKLGSDPYNLGRMDRRDSLIRLESVDRVGETGRTALMGAAVTGNLELAKLLLERGADPDACDSQDWTPLLLAADENHAAMIRLLAGRGADLTATTHNGQTGLHLAAWQNHLEAARTLIELGVPVEAADAEGNTALHLAATEPVPEMVRLLAPRMGVDVRNADYGGTPLMSAAAGGLLENVQVLLELGADPAARDADGESAADYARNRGHRATEEFLQDRWPG